MPAAEYMRDMVARSSFIRKMFEEGLRLKEKFGPDKVYDFSIGNPDLPPPPEFKETLKELAEEMENHGYMPNPGWPQVRTAVAEYLTKEQGVELKMDQVVMTAGAAGGLHVALKSIFNPGEELITPAPFFVEYGTYVETHGGRLVTVPAGPGFGLDPEAVEAALTERTRAVLINSPHNPTGAVYNRGQLEGLARVLEAAKARWNRRIYLISDEPYRKIVYDGLTVPSIFQVYPHSFLVTSYSKELSLAGERIGFVAVHPGAEDVEELCQAMVIANRIFYVNAPSMMQLAVGRLQGVSVDSSAYQRRRDMFYQGLTEAGYQVDKPGGAFYLFPKSPLQDDVAFTALLKEERILVVPGSGFGGPGYFRISYAVPDRTISDSLEGFKRALEKA
jgi:aspartate aminotransferase